MHDRSLQPVPVNAEALGDRLNEIRTRYPEVIARHGG